MNDDVRKSNEGTSDYAQHKYQSWDYWIRLHLNPFDADLLKRTLRHKSTDPAELDIKKRIHISKERIRQLSEHRDSWPTQKYDAKLIQEGIKDYDLTPTNEFVYWWLTNKKLWGKFPFTRKAKIHKYEIIIQVLELELTKPFQSADEIKRFLDL